MFPFVITGTDDDLMITATMMTMVRLNYDDKVNNTFNKDLSIESDLESVSSGVNTKKEF